MTLLTIMVFTFALASSAVAATTPMFFPGTIGEFVVGDKAVDLNLSLIIRPLLRVYLTVNLEQALPQFI
jgi:hypothetical protein